MRVRACRLITVTMGLKPGRPDEIGNGDGLGRIEPPAVADDAGGLRIAGGSGVSGVQSHTVAAGRIENPGEAAVLIDDA